MNHSFAKNLASFFVAISFILRVFSPGPLAGASDIPANLDNGLRELYAEEQPSGKSAAIMAPRVLGIARKAIRDNQRRVLVSVHLDGKAPMSDVRDRIVAAGGNVIAESSKYKNGVLSAFIPVNKLAELAQSPGVLSMSMGRRPIRNVGATTSGGVFAIHADALIAQGISGTGITVGVLSDSYDKATTDLNGNPLTVHAAQDVASGDLPGTGNPDNPNPVVVLEEFDPSVPDNAGIAPADEGRAMLQIVHDVAPKAKLAFATGFNGDVDFANNIRRLRTDANCDVIVDDVLSTEEPFFSDGMVAQAVDDVVFSDSSTLAGHKCAYFASAGNQQGGGYLATFNPISDAAARAPLPGQNLQLNQVPAALTTGGFHNFNPDPAGPPDISQTFFVPADSTLEIDFQWNDPFDQPGGVTTDYNILIFDAAGNYIPEFSGTADNMATQQAIEDITIKNTGGDANFQIAISRAGTSPATPVATKLRYLAIDDFGDGVGALEYYQPDAACTFGHFVATGAFGTAAYLYDSNPSNPVRPPFTPVIEDFTSPGPGIIDFDASGNRLAESEIRQKPDIAAPDGGNTTFFGEDDLEGDHFPNFFGTSAAAPHAAGVAALLLQKAGGPASLTFQQMKDALQSSVLNPHDIDPFFSQVTAGRARGRKGRRAAGASIHITASGNSSNASASDPNFFTINFTAGPRGGTLQQVKIDLREIGLKFDTTLPPTGSPFTLGRLVGISPGSIAASARPGDESFKTLIINFAPGSFSSASSVSFGIDRDFVGDGFGNQADLLEGAVVTGTTSLRGKLSGKFVNQFGTGYTIVDGFGLIDAVKAAQAVP